MPDYSNYYLQRIAKFGNYNFFTDLGWGGREDPTTHSDMLVPLVWRGHSFGRCHKYAYNLWMNLLDDLVPHIPGGLKNGQLGCYVDRDIRGSSSRSAHSGGIAIDVNWGENAMGTESNYGHKYVLPRITHDIARRWGCEWGGDWSGRRDSMHIEIHLTPEQTRHVPRHKYATLRFRTKQVAQKIKRAVKKIYPAKKDPAKHLTPTKK